MQATQKLYTPLRTGSSKNIGYLMQKAGVNAVVAQAEEGREGEGEGGSTHTMVEGGVSDLVPQAKAEPTPSAGQGVLRLLANPQWLLGQVLTFVGMALLVWSYMLIPISIAQSM
ncbi:hypothetical protein KIPB_014516, partial [Kipferlia bialata]|eukprot:g14516.t1